MGAITAAVIAAGGAVYAANKSAKASKEANAVAREGIEAADPFKQYRPQYATKLNELMSDPSQIQNTPEYKARIQSVQRQLAAQGYTGSGNALVEAAEASGAVYQQAFSNLAMLSGAATTPGGGYGNAVSAMQNGSAQNLSATSGVVNNLANLALTVGQRWNQPSQAQTSTTATNPITGSTIYG